MALMNGNGNGRSILWWVLGGLVAPLLVGTVSHLFTAVAQHGERLSSMEVKQVDLLRRLADIERKLDRLIENQNHHR
jgi:hypothetical protein